MNEASAKKELPACPVETTLTLIGDKWKVLILRDLIPGNPRENIQGIELLTKNDEVHIFYAGQNTYYAQPKNQSEVDAKTEATVTYYKIHAGKNAVDFAISIEAAEKMHSSAGQNIFLLSADKHFDLIVSILRRKIKNGISVTRIDSFWKGVVMNPGEIETWDRFQKLMKSMLGKDGEALCHQMRKVCINEQKQQQAIQPQTTAARRFVDTIVKKSWRSLHTAKKALGITE